MAEKTSSSFSTSNYAYDVFLSFRGEDTRKVFTSRLYSAFSEAGFATFIDDNGIERGEDIKSELIRAIRHSRGSIVVLSENYANSSWCLDELALILLNRKRKGHVVLPVFYYVTPTQVGKQMGSFTEAFSKYERRCAEEIDEQKKFEWMNKIRKWRSSLTAVAELPGMVLRPQDVDGANDTLFIQKIISAMEDKLNRAVLSDAPTLIGIHSRVKSINSWLHDGSSGVNILFLCGVGGIGKTTVAKVAYNLNFERFQMSIFLPNVRETSEKHGLVHLQKELLSYTEFGASKIVNSIEEGILQIENACGCQRLLLVMDDVDQTEQAYAILGKRNWLCSGSKVIITTRHKVLLKSCKDYIVENAKPLDDLESSELFCWYAFGQDHPSESYEAFIPRILNRCGGLPLALKILGSSLSGRRHDVWEDTLKKLNEIPNFQIAKLLKLSYDALVDDHDRNLFLHIVCFFIWEEKNRVVNILDGCNFQTMVGLQNLIDRCLLEINTKNRLTMHQLLQDMGRDVVRQESPRIPGNRSRLWRYKDSFNVLREKTGTEAIEGLILDMEWLLVTESEVAGFEIGHIETIDDAARMINGPCLENVLNLEMDTFEKMKKLRLLRLNYMKFSGSLKKFPKNLRWLCWHGFPLNCIPDAFSVENIIVLDMSKSLLKKIWKQNKVAECLKILDLSDSRELTRTPSFTGFPNLEMLKLSGCWSLSKVHESIGTLKGLVYLDLKDCKSLRKLPQTLTMLHFLETLIISGCSNLNEFPAELETMTSLKVFAADGVALGESGTGDDVGCRDIACFSYSSTAKPRKVVHMCWASLPKSLVSLSLVNCNLSDDSFPRELVNLQSLEKLDLSSNSFCYLPDFVRCLSQLEELDLNQCYKLTSLLDLPDIRELQISDCLALETITYTSTSAKVQNISLHYNCRRLVEVQGYFSLKPIGSISAEMLNSLGFSNCKSMGNAVVELQDGISHLIMRRPCQLLYEFGIFSTSIPGKEVPNWFDQKCPGSSISFTVPSIPNLQPHGLNICLAYALSTTLCMDTWSPEHQLFVKVTNLTKNLTWIYFPTCFGIPDIDQELLWLSHWTFKGQLGCGDEFDVLIVSGDTLQIKECGINVVYHELDVNVKNGYLSWKQVIGGDLWAFELSTGVYYLCRVSIQYYDKDLNFSRIVDWTTTTKWGTSLLGGSVGFIEVVLVDWEGRYIFSMLT